MAEIKKVYKNGTAYDVLNSDTVGSALTAGTGIGISSNTISNTGVTSVNGSTGAVTVNDTKVASSAPTASEGTLWYDTANDKLKAYNGSSWDEIGGGITKIFTLSSTSDLTNAQAAYDWYVSGGNPIIRVSPGLSNLYLGTITSTTLKFTRASSYGAESNGFWASVTGYVFTISSGSVTAVTSMDNYIKTSSSAPGSGTGNNIITFVI